jgi:hypothetical protein
MATGTGVALSLEQYIHLPCATMELYGAVTRHGLSAHLRS